MNPDKQDCYGLYLFGAGYYADEDERRKAVTRDDTHFCQRCPVAPECNDLMRATVQGARPDLTEEYEKLMKEAYGHGLTELAASYHLSRLGKHPYQARASANFSQGRTFRRREKRAAGEVASSAG